MPASEAETTDNSLRTEDDWHEVKADVKQLVNALRSLNPPKEVESKREFRRLNPQRAHKLQRNLRPTDQNLEILALQLVPMFTTFQNNNQSFIFLNNRRSINGLPTFANKMVLRIPKNLLYREASPNEFYNMLPSNLSETQASKIRNYFIENRAKAEDRSREQVHEGTNAWKWCPEDRNRYFNLYYVHSNNEQTNTCKAISIVREKLDFDPESGYGHGVLCLIETPLQDGVLDIRWVNLIVTQTSRWHLKPDELHFSRVIYFLGVFAGFWLSRNERLRFACSKSPGFDFLNWYLQVHLRYFADAAQPIKSKDAGGLQCTREKGGIVSNSLKVVLRSFEEKRISVFGYFRIDDYSPSAFYSVLALRETKFSDLDGYILKWRPGLQGTIAFQFAVLASVDTWETEWNKVLDQIDDCVYFHLEQTLDPNEINTWMFDDNFERSRLYFNILQFLRIFGEWIGTVSDDLRPLDDLFLKRTDFPMREMRQDELQALRSNWKLVRETQETAQKNLMDRVLNKTEEIKSLRDGLFNTSSLREAKESSRQANRSSEMSRYVLIFTVVTVLYLPPSFISTVFALEIFKKDPAQTKWEYKVALVSVSLFTYTMALALVIAADWKKFRGRCSSWWIKFSQWRGDSLSGENTSGSLDDSASDVPASLAQEQEGSKPKEARPAREAGDEESGPHEAKKQRFFRFPGTSKSGEPSDRKGKAPENIPMTAVSTSNK